MLVEVDGLFHIVLSWGGKPAGGRGEEQRELYDRCIGCVGDHGKKLLYKHTVILTEGSGKITGRCSGLGLARGTRPIMLGRD